MAWLYSVPTTIIHRTPDRDIGGSLSVDKLGIRHRNVDEALDGRCGGGSSEDVVSSALCA